MAARPHILVVNGRKVRQPVFVIGAPYSGTDALARALKRSAGFHMTIGQPAVTSVVHAFARSPSIQRGKGEAATTVLRDAFAQAWQVTPDSCLGCSAACRSAGGVNGAGTCITERDILRYGDASPDLMYCAESLVEAFGDARIVQIIRDGRDVVASMLGDTALISVFRPSLANVEGDLPNPFFGLETPSDLASWPRLSLAARCALHWRGAVRQMARLRTGMSAEQLTTLRYEEVVRSPATAGRAVSEFIGARVALGALPRTGPRRVVESGSWRRLLSPAQVKEIEQVAGTDLRRVGYGT